MKYKTYPIGGVRWAAMALLRSLRSLVQRERRVPSQRLAWYCHPPVVAAPPPMIVFPSSFLFPRRKQPGGKAQFRFAVVDADWWENRRERRFPRTKQGMRKQVGGNEMLRFWY